MFVLEIKSGEPPVSKSMPGRAGRGAWREGERSPAGAHTFLTPWKLPGNQGLEGRRR